MMVGEEHYEALFWITLWVAFSGGACLGWCMAKLHSHLKQPMKERDGNIW